MLRFRVLSALRTSEKNRGTLIYPPAPHTLLDRRVEMAMPVPPKLKPVTQYVRRAENLDRAPEPEAPVVAYYCRLYATEQAMKLQDKSEEG